MVRRNPIRTVVYSLVLGLGHAAEMSREAHKALRQGGLTDGMSKFTVLNAMVRGLGGESELAQASNAGRQRKVVGLGSDKGTLLPFGWREKNRTGTGLTSLGDGQARAKVRASDARLVFAWSSAGLRLVS